MIPDEIESRLREVEGRLWKIETKAYGLETQVWSALAAIVVIGIILALLLASTGKRAEGAEAAEGPSAALWAAQVEIESGGDPSAYKADEDAAGIVQIRPCVPADLRRLGLLAGPVDRFDPAEGRRVWALYLGYYGARYRKATGRTPTAEVYARIWNGGPKGWRKSSTLAYWRKVRAAMEDT